MKYLEMDPVSGKTVLMHIRPAGAPPPRSVAQKGTVLVEVDDLVARKLVDGKLVPDTDRPVVPSKPPIANPYRGMNPQQIAERISGLKNVPELQTEVAEMAKAIAAMLQR